jgi:hypothetical protein
MADRFGASIQCPGCGGTGALETEMADTGLPGPVFDCPTCEGVGVAGVGVIDASDEPLPHSLEPRSPLVADPVIDSWVEKQMAVFVPQELMYRAAPTPEGA